jgi:hypothetical protein
VHCIYFFDSAMNSDTKIRSIGLAGLATVALWVTLSLGSCFYLCLQSSRWPKLPVRIVSSGVDTGISNVGRWWSPDIEFEYGVNGKIYHSTSVRYFMPAFYQQGEARAIQAEYPKGSQTKAAYDPANPGRGVLEPGVPTGLWARAIIPVFLWSLCGAILYEMKNPQRRILVRSIPEEANCD